MLTLIIMQLVLLVFQITLGHLSIEKNNDTLMVLSYTCFGLILVITGVMIFK